MYMPPHLFYHAAAGQESFPEVLVWIGSNMSSFNIISFGRRKENFLIALSQGVIGSSLSTFKESVKPGATIFLHCDAKIWATARVEGDYFYSENRIWPDKVYPHRFKIAILKFAKQPVALSDGVINTKFRERFGAGWAYRFIFSPKPIPADIAQLILKRIEQTGFASEGFDRIINTF
jgi:hypothetical protein